ncbi:uncharacterized protein LOC110854200 isoform X2 [Folsomia candida]|nr:uncharacterized protein LOC110854200 isoform X2 [Folsomia candida]
MIPFTGGKVCNVVASGDESEVAVASIRGRVALYRISPTIHVLQSRREKEPRGMRSSPGDAFRHLYDVPYHVNNEVTEMRWSPNGKFLFVGDNQGVISQTDVASLDEFPRPPPSRIILRLQSRILQIDCSFPYLAISTLAATFLCDLEKEDFTRIIQSDANNSSKRDIKSAGLCFVPLEVQGGREHLLIGEVETGRIFRCGMDGGVISCQKVDLSPGTRGPVGFFDPKKCDPPRCPGTYQDFNYSPSKMFPTEDGKFIISVSSNRIFLYDAKSCQILAWNEDFNRINSLKIVANYGLLWYGGKLQVFALTPFRSYGRQLFKAGLTSLLENWISYTLSLLGYQGQTDAQNNNNGNNYTAIKAFREMMSPIEEDDEFCIFVGNFVPFDLIDPEAKKRKLEGESYDKKLRRGVKKLVDSVKSTETDKNINFSTKIRTMLTAVTEFYMEMFPFLGTNNNKDGKISSLTLLRVLASTHLFLKQREVTTLKQDLAKYYLEESVISGVCGPILKCVQSGGGSLDKSENDNDISEFCNFLHLAKNLLVQKYFKDLGISPEMVAQDALVADVTVLLLPLISDKVLYANYMASFEPVLSKMFFTWVVILTFFEDKTHLLPFSGMLRAIQNPQVFDKLVDQIVSSVYREVIFPRGDETSVQIQAVNYFPHFVTFALLYAKCGEISKLVGAPRSMSSLVLNLFPLKRSVKEDLVQKIIQLSSLNPVLFKMLYKGCLEDGRSLRLCGCGIQGGFGTLEGIVPPFQRAIEEGVLHVLVGQYFERGDVLPSIKMPIHLFAMRRCLILPYLQSSVCDDILPDHVKLLMLSRSRVCSGLEHISFNLENLQVIRDAVTKRKKDKFASEKEACSSCRKELLSNNSAFEGISMDCVGVWMIENSESIEKFMEILEKLGLNSRGEFSLRFFQLIIRREELRNKKRRKEDAGLRDVVSLSNLTCSILHNKNK